MKTDSDHLKPVGVWTEQDHQREVVVALLRERLDYWLPGGKGLRSKMLPELARELVKRCCQ